MADSSMSDSRCPMDTVHGLHKAMIINMRAIKLDWRRESLLGATVNPNKIENNIPKYHHTHDIRKYLWEICIPNELQRRTMGANEEHGQMTPGEHTLNE